ncbi:MAG: DCC1-like thiol-disulfide oxidoreductase family protein [Actinomycetota bacterium]
MKTAILLYDDDCGFCRWSADRLLGWERVGRLRAVGIRSSEGVELLAGVSDERRLASWHLITEDGRRYSAGDATAPLFRRLQFGSPVAFFAESFPGIGRWAYAVLAANRFRFGRWLGTEACSVDPSRRARGGHPTLSER